MDEYGLTTVELGSVGYKDDQWVLANRVMQVAYYPKHFTQHFFNNYCIELFSISVIIYGTCKPCHVGSVLPEA